jgi:hypothetical protein
MIPTQFLLITGSIFIAHHAPPKVGIGVGLSFVIAAGVYRFISL